MGIRTDLALEAHEMFSKEATKEEKEGIEFNKEENGGIVVTRIGITNKNGEETLGKPMGRYITIEVPELIYDTKAYEKACRILAKELRRLIGKKEDLKTLVVGLGNRQITPDALGPDVIKNLIVTGHIKEGANDFLGDEMSSVYAISPGVLGTTGIESAEIISAVTERIKPDVVIVADALAARSLDRIKTTIQLSDTGINPGSGVKNKRKALNKESLGVTVIAIGVPTVVDAATIVGDSIDMAANEANVDTFKEEFKNEIIKKTLTKNIQGLMVTPKDIDMVIEKAAKTVANGINMALHKNLTFEDIESYVG